MEREEILALLALYSMKEIPKGRIKELRKKVGNLLKLFSFKKSELECLGLSEKCIKKIKDINYKDFEKYLNDKSLKIVTIFDEDFPLKLKEIINPPLFLFLKGNINLLNKKMFSIVGTRRSSDKAIAWGKKAAKVMINNGFAIISGGAKGIDTGAHKGALMAGGATVCVLGGGVNNPYPKENSSLFDKILKQDGLLISETLPDEPVNRYNLLLRNRITSALSDGMLIVASREKGGAMWQSKVAVLQKKHIFCPSLSLKLEPYDGPKQLIKKKVAIAIEDPKRIVEYLNKTTIIQKTLTQTLK